MTRFLIAEDDEKSRYFLAALLRGVGHEVDEAANGVRALELARAHPPEMVISDALMPSMDGFVLCRELKKDERLRSIPFVFYTATYTEEADERYARSLGAADYLRKPLDPDDLLAALGRILEGGRGGSRGVPDVGPSAGDSDPELYASLLSRKLTRKLEQLQAANQELQQELTARHALEGELQLINATLEKRVEERTEALARNRRLLDETSHLSQVGGWEYDLRTNELTWTDVTYEIHELEKGAPQLIEKALDYYAPESRPRINEVFERAVSTGEPYDEELELITAKGQRKWVRAIGYADLEDGKVIRVHGLFQDIQIHRIRLAALEKANKEIESFSYSVSHDLRAPLRHIHGFIELFLESASGSLDDKSLRYIRLVSEAAKKMGVLIDNLLAFSRIGRVELRAAPTPLRPLVEEVIRDLAPDISGREIVWDISPLPEVIADSAMLRQVWWNLIGNALKFSRTRTPARIEIGAVDAGVGETHFFVRDNGVGFDMKYVDKLFGVFQRLHTTEQFDGVGIGLANVQRIVQRHGGRVWAEGIPDAGATFWFSLPKEQKAT